MEETFLRTRVWITKIENESWWRKEGDRKKGDTETEEWDRDKNEKMEKKMDQ